jgi:membrane-bound lytic murein transglycosylase A
MKVEITPEPVSFSALDGWESDDHLAAFETFLRSCHAVLKQAAANTPDTLVPLVEACRAAQSRAGSITTSKQARAFFEAHFTPHRVVHEGAEGLLTGYYEPVLEGSREPGGRYSVPVYRRPPELVNLVEEAQRGAVGNRLTHARKTANGTEPYFTRTEIEEGALDGRGLELVWLTDPVETFMMHVQGSGRIRLPDGGMIRISYDGKNGYPYTSVGRYLIDSQQFPADRMSLDAMKEWLRVDEKRGREAMRQNKSFIFFRELTGTEAESAMGVMDIPLTTGRSLAVDGGYHDIGTPVWVVAPQLTHATASGGWRRLMIAQDVGSAIKGPERGDLYFGSGSEAGKLAGVTKHPAKFFVLLANNRTASQVPKLAEAEGAAQR